MGWDDPGIARNSFGATGHRSVLSFLLNLAYDVPLSPKWDFSFGAGAGVGRADVDATEGSASLSDTEQGYMWQGFAGFAYSIRPNVDITLDWRYRSLSLNKRFGNDLGICGQLMSFQ